MSGAYNLFGALASPYSMKMLAVMRYRRLHHVWRAGQTSQDKALREVKVPVIPVLQFPEGGYANDSTVLIDILEQRHHERSLNPVHTGDAFLAFLLEDFADEWLTKCMFQYRWRREIDQQTVSRWLAFDHYQGGGREQIETFSTWFAARQIERMSNIVSSPMAFELIEETAAEVMGLIDAQAIDRFFFFGSRPSRAEFAFFGQLSQLAIDPTSGDRLRKAYPFCKRWIDNFYDLSGISGDWTAGEAQGSNLIAGMLKIIGDVYLPFLSANASAVAEQKELLDIEIRGHRVLLRPFKYQAKCFAELRSRYAALDVDAQNSIRTSLSRTGCLPYLQG